MGIVCEKGFFWLGKSRVILTLQKSLSPQFAKSNASQVTLMNLDFDASGNYFCEVSIDNPIFTKASAEEHLHVIGECLWSIAVCK